jgi:hypothetical protein
LAPSAELVLVPLVLEVPVLFELLCVVWRSPNRFTVPRIAPRLEAGAPGAPDAAVCPVRAVFVLVVAAVWLEELVDEDVDEVELVLPVVAVELGALVELETSDLPEPYEPEAPRLPRSRGADSAANLSALTTPLTRMVLSRSPVRIVAVRKEITVVFVFGVPNWRQVNHASPRVTASATTSHPHVLLGFFGSWRKISGMWGACAGVPDPGMALETGALLM